MPSSQDHPSSRSLRIVFLGTPLFAAACLEQLLLSRHQVVGVVTAPDRPAGRGRSLKASAVKEVAVQHGLPIAQPEKLKAPEFHAVLDEWSADLGVVVAFRMLPGSGESAGAWHRQPPRFTPSQYRGAAPIHWAVLNGETETGASTFFCNTTSTQATSWDGEGVHWPQRHHRPRS